MSSGRDYMTIGEVVKQLKPRFPDLSISKVRYYEEENLINPERTQGGYRKFSEEDVRRLELALSLQRDKYMPLNVIRKNLALMDMGQAPPEIKQMTSGNDQSSLDPGDNEPVLAEQAINNIGISPEMAKMLESFGIIRPFKTVEGKCYGPVDVQLMTIARDMAKYGIEPRHLRMYSSLAEKEFTLFQQILYPVLRQKGEDRDLRVREMLEKLSEFSNQIKALLLKKQLQDYMQATQ
ncbi:MAG TPA: MerR family transcriptional regulator [Anaerolineae bacterium]|jgi:DNA-binding transcriptional MerR regulator|nr:MerR family transcriptional regulator [Anaerolineae bacterium]